MTRDPSLSDVYVSGDNVTMTGLELQAPSPMPDDFNKELEVIGNAFTLENSIIDNQNTGGTALYIDDPRSTLTTSHVQSFTIEDNEINKGEITISDGVGLQGPASGRLIEGNLIHNVTDFAGISIMGQGVRPWAVNPVGSLTITGNTLENNLVQIIARGVEGSYSDPNWQALLADNTFDKAVIALTPSGDAEVSTDQPLSDDPAQMIGTSVQEGVDRAAPGDTVQVLAGTYVEQVTIDKNITLTGAGNSTVIQSPGTLTAYFTTSDVNKAVVYVHDTDDAKVENLTVDGAGQGNANYQFDGIAYYQAGGTVDTVEVKNVEDTLFDGAQDGVGIYADADNSTARSLEVTNSNVHDFQKSGMVFSGQNLTVNVHGNTVTGAGDTSVIAQNGIEVLDGASGTIGGSNAADGNTITGLSYTGPDYVTDVGILGSGAGLLTISNNYVNISSNDATVGSSAIVVEGSDTPVATLPAPTISDNTIVGNNLFGDTGIWADGPATIENNTITGEIRTGIFVFNGQWALDEYGNPTAQQNPFWTGAGATITGNTITGSGDYSSGNYSTGITVSGNATISSNVVTQVWYGIDISAAAGESVIVTNNQLSGVGGGYSVALSVEDTPATATVTLGGNRYATTFDNYIVLDDSGYDGSAVNLDATGEYFDATYNAGAGTVTGGTLASTGTLAQQFGFADKIIDAVDIEWPGLGSHQVAPRLRYGQLQPLFGLVRHHPQHPARHRRGLQRGHGQRCGRHIHGATGGHRQEPDHNRRRRYDDHSVPATMATEFTTSAPNDPIVYFTGTTSGNINNVEIDGLGNGNANYRFEGIAYYNAGGTVNQVAITGIRDNPFDGAGGRSPVR